jgi:hypothetical protein
MFQNTGFIEDTIWTYNSGSDGDEANTKSDKMQKRKIVSLHTMMAHRGQSYSSTRS